jgi:hypothetical protein
MSSTGEQTGEMEEKKRRIDTSDVVTDIESSPDASFSSSSNSNSANVDGTSDMSEKGSFLHIVSSTRPRLHQIAVTRRENAKEQFLKKVNEGMCNIFRSTDSGVVDGNYPQNFVTFMISARPYIDFGVLTLAEAEVIVYNYVKETVKAFGQDPSAARLGKLPSVEMFANRESAWCEVKNNVQVKFQFNFTSDALPATISVSNTSYADD